MHLLEHDHDQTTRHIQLLGPLNIRHKETLTRQFERLAADGVQTLVLDLSRVPYIDSKGLGALITGYKAFDADPARFQIHGLQDQPRLLLELTGFDRIFNIVDQPAPELTVAA